MKMIRRIASFFLMLCFLTSVFQTYPASAVDSASIDQLEIVRALGIMEGDEDGNLNLSATVRRGEFVKMMVAASSYKDTIGDGTGTSLFKDVKSNYWASEFIKRAVESGWFVGYTDGTFRPNNSITLAEAAASLLRLLGYDSSSLAGTFPSAQMTKARSIGLLDNVNGTSSTLVTRGDCVTLFYNLMVSKNFAGNYYLNVIEPSLNLVSSAGEIDLVSLVNQKVTGPVKASSEWQSLLPFTMSNADFYRNGKEVAASAIQRNDVLYYSKSMRTVWAFSNKITGTITSLSPNPSEPTAVTVAGQIYTIETASAAYDLSNIGAYGLGSMVTLLLGRDGGVAFVVGSTSVSSDNFGVVINADEAAFTDSSGHAYMGNAIKILGIDGNQYLYPNESSVSYEQGNVVQIKVSETGTTITRIRGGSVSGTVNAEGTYLGKTHFSDDAKVLDIYDGNGKTIPMSRLAGSKISSSDIYFVSTNPTGEIDVLILNDFTGDVHDYGLITSVKSVDKVDEVGKTTLNTYTYDVGGTAHTWTDAVVRSQKREPIQICTEDGEFSYFKSLTAFNIESISDVTVTGNGESHVLADDVVVYLYDHDTYNYYMSSLNHVTSGEYTLTAYYDKLLSEGGRVRIILAR